MQGNFNSPLKAIINPPGIQSGMPGDTLEIHAVVMNQGDQSAIIDVFLDEAFRIFYQSPVMPRERVALAAGQSTEVSFRFEIPLDLLPGTYDYTLVIDAPEHYPQDTPIAHPRQIKVLVKEQTIVREHDPNFSLTPTSNPGNPLIFQPNQPLQIAISVDNRSRRVDSFRLTCPDLEENWYTIGYLQPGLAGQGLVTAGSGLELNPSNVGQIAVTVHPPTDALAGSYILTLRLHSENSPNLVLLDLIYIQIPPDYRLNIELNTILGQIKRSFGQYEIKLANLGNTPRQVAFSAKTQAEDELCTYEFTPASVKLFPSKSTVVNLAVKPMQWWRRPLVGNGLLVNFQVELQDQQQLPLTPASIQSTLVWKARPWWQFLFSLLIGLGLLGGLGLIIWKILHPGSVKLVEFKLNEQQIDEGGWGLLSWKIDDVKDVKKIILTTTGSSQQKREYDLAELIAQDNTREPLCIEDNKSLICKNFKTEAKLPGEYKFQLKIFDKNDNEIDKKTTEALTIVPKPEPEVIGFKLTTPGKLKYAQGEAIAIDWTIKNLQKLAGVQAISKAEDGSIPFDQTILEPKLTQGGSCRLNQEKQQMNCTNFPIKILQPGKYELQIKPISKSDPKSKPDTSPATPLPQIKVEVLPKSLRIVEFTINGSNEASRIVKEGEPLTIKWQVEGDEKAQIELIPGGTVPRSGSQQLQSIQGISQISLTATDNYGHKQSKIFSIKVEAAGTPNSSPTTPNPVPGTPPVKIPGDLKDF